MDADETIGAAGPKLVLLDGALDLACRRSFPTPEISFYRMAGLSKLFPRSKRFGRYNMTYLDPDTETEVDSVVGAFMLVRRTAIQRVGLFDETFFMYGEDLDWAYRIKQAGWKVMYNPRVTVTHVKRAASRQSKRAQREFYRAMLIFYRKHTGRRRHGGWQSDLMGLACGAVPVSGATSSHRQLARPVKRGADRQIAAFSARRWFRRRCWGWRLRWAT
jgi:GT2 family glycosyltransferase